MNVSEVYNDDMAEEFIAVAHSLTEVQAKSLIAGIFVIVGQIEQNKELPPLTRKAIINLVNFAKTNLNEDGTVNLELDLGTN